MLFLTLSTLRGNFCPKNVQFLGVSSFTCNSALQLNLGCAECPKHGEYWIFAHIFTSKSGLAQLLDQHFFF